MVRSGGYFFKIVASVGFQTVAPNGDALYTGHCLRVGGAQFLAAAGLPLETIMLLGRWASEVVRRYIAEAPLKAATMTLKRKMAESANFGLQALIAEQRAERVQASMASTASWKSLVADLDRITCRAAELERMPVVSPPAENTSSSFPQYVVNYHTRCWHNVPPTAVCSHPAGWATLCGWRYGSSVVVRASALPEQLSPQVQCDRCFG